MNRLEIAIIGKPFGLKGQVHAFSKTSFPKLRLKKGYVYELVSPDEKTIVKAALISFSIKGETFILGFEGINNPEEAATINKYSLTMDKDDAPMPEGYVRYDELLGMTAIDEDGKELGELIEVCEFAITPSLRFKSVNGKVFYVPFIDDFVKTIDYENKTIVIHVVEGML